MVVINNYDFIVSGGAPSAATDILVAGGASSGTAWVYFINGGNATQVTGFSPLDSGSYALEGYDAGILRTIGLESGSYDSSGGSLEFSRSVELQSASYTVSGGELLAPRLASFDSGSYSTSGNDIETAFYDYTAPLGAGSLSLNGAGLEFSRSLRLGVENGVFDVVGSDTGLARQLRITLDPGSYQITGQSIDTSRTYKIVLSAGSFAVAGVTANFDVSRRIALDAGSYSLVEQDAGVLKVLPILLESGSYSLEMEEAQVRPGDPTLIIDRGIYNLTGSTLNLQVTAAKLLGRYRPTRRRYRPPAYSITTVKSHSGNSYRRLWASKPSNGILEIEIDNMFDFDAEDLCRLYDEAQGTYGYIGLPKEFYDGASAELTAMMAQPDDGLKWAFDEPPSITGVKGEVCDVALKFRARRTPALTA